MAEPVCSDELSRLPTNCTFQHRYSNKTFAVWDQIASIRGDPSSVQDGTFFKFNSQFDVEEHFSATVTSGGLFGLFSASAEFDQAFSLALKRNTSVKYEHGKVNAFVAELDTNKCIRGCGA